MYAYIENFIVKKFPILNIRQELPEISLPETILAEHLPAGYVEVHNVEPPAYDSFTQTLQEATPALVNGKWVRVWDVVPIAPEVIAANLANLKAEAASSIDSAAGVARTKYITVSPGQEGTYLMKAQRAREFVAANYQGNVPFLVQAEVTATGVTPQQACADILAQEAAWEYKAGQIETARRKGKERVKAATTSEEINGHRDDALSALAQL